MEAAAEIAIGRLANPAVIPNRRMLTLAEEPFDAYRTYVAEYAIEQARLLYSENLRLSLERTWTNRANKAAGKAVSTTAGGGQRQLATVDGG
ncbi:hypothetical protein [Actinospica sp.]|jgi:thioesterase DpgC|uniref:hypothetical protein n=1 Tax=Actinospica sp. TaxID=1872142 RepID=UPI002BF59133|nr:hypothetical protein [Actinospica sp.]HWG24198.1 hypothetical protein [Actinospica sp.]